MNLLFPALEDRAPVRTDSSANAGFTRRVMLVRRSFLFGYHHSSWKTKCEKPRAWAEPSEPKAPLCTDAVTLAHRLGAVDHDPVGIMNDPITDSVRNERTCQLVSPTRNIVLGAEDR